MVCEQSTLEKNLLLMIKVLSNKCICICSKNMWCYVIYWFWAMELHIFMINTVLCKISIVTFCLVPKIINVQDFTHAFIWNHVFNHITSNHIHRSYYNFISLSNKRLEHRKKSAKLTQLVRSDAYGKRKKYDTSQLHYLE